MAERADQTEAATAGTRSLSQRLTALVAQVRRWAAERPWRSAAIGTSLLGMVLATVLAWVYLPNLAVVDSSVTLDEALQAWDERRLDEATDLVRQLQRNPGFGEMVGGALFILGAVKAQEAEKHWSALRQQSDYLIASRYLEEARQYGFPEGRESEGLYWLGKSLVENKQLLAGIDVLNEALANNAPQATEIHQLLARANFNTPDPRLDAALGHNAKTLEDEALPDSERSTGLLLKSKILIGQRAYDEALGVLSEIPVDINNTAWIELLKGEALLQSLDQSDSEPTDSPDEVPTSEVQALDQAAEHLQTARSLDRTTNQITRRATYFLGLASQMQGNLDQAMQDYSLLRSAHSSTPEGLAAAIAAAELLQAQDKDEQALLEYRRVLQTAGPPGEYRNPIVPLSQLQNRIRDAANSYVDNGQYKNALALLEHYPPLFDESEQSEQQALTYERWADNLHDRQYESLRTAEERWSFARDRLRHAGAAYERLSKLRFATRHYSDDVWKGADCYYRGQSYTSAARLLNEYLRHEPERRNPQALLRLSQSQLALGDIEKSMSALEECIEFHPQDEAVYQARIDLSRCHRLQGNVEQAEELLEDNLSRSLLTPRSPEWRESLLEMGSLLHEIGRYSESISYLQRYLKRLQQSRESYDAPRLHNRSTEFQQLSATYIIGNSHRLSASDPLEKLAAARSQGERDKIRRSVDQDLITAEEKFNEVVVKITTRDEGYRGDKLLESMLRNAYMMLGSVLFDQGKYKQASEVYSNVSSLYQHSPFVLETYVQIAHCWRRMNRPDKARGMIESAQFVLDELPPDADYLKTTSFSREEWQSLIDEMAAR